MKIKKVISILLVLSVFACFCACSNTNGVANSEIHYSNIVDEKEIKELSSLLENSGVPKNNAEKIISSISYYNKTIGSDLLKSDGIIDLSSPIPQYDDTEIDERWLSANDLFVGYNCRLTAFEIMKDFMTVDDTTKANPMALFMDEDALSNSSDNYFTDDELLKFEAIYSTINTTSSTDVNEQYKAQQEYWNSIGVKFNNDEKISLISVYIHNHFSDEENELLIGHTGVLINDNGKYVFLEKLSFQAPYQMIRFNTKDELKQYLMAAYDTDTTGECSKPFILENNNIM